MPSLMVFLTVSCNDVQKSSSQEEKDSQRMISYEKERLIEKLESLKRVADSKLVEVEGQLVEADSSEMAELRQVNARLIDQKATIVNRLFQLRNTNSSENWESIRQSTQAVIDSISENIEKYEK